MTLLAARLRRELASNGNVLTTQVRRWMDRLAQLVKALRGRLSAGAMRGALGSLAVFFGLASASGQSFAPGVPNAFGLTVPPGEMTTRLPAPLGALADVRPDPVFTDRFC